MNIKDKMTDDYTKDMLVRMAHHSTAIEGNTLTLAETVSILINNYIPREMPEKDYNEIRNYRMIFPILLNSAGQELTTELIKEYNKIVMTNLRDDAGQYKKIGNIVLGAEFEPTKPYQVPYVMQDWCDNYNFRIKNAKTTEEKVEIILDQHIKFERIHPFGDGNGRTGRLLIMDSCLRENLAPIIIPKAEKNKYINFLANEDVKNFTKWALELQKKELERMKLFQNNENLSKNNVRNEKREVRSRIRSNSKENGR